MTVGVAGPCVGGQGKGKRRERMREDKGAYGGYRGCMAKSVVRRLKSGGWVWERLYLLVEQAGINISHCTQ
jgi:hypothetical protein